MSSTLKVSYLSEVVEGVTTIVHVKIINMTTAGGSSFYELMDEKGCRKIYYLHYSMGRGVAIGHCYVIRIRTTSLESGLHSQLSEFTVLYGSTSGVLFRDPNPSDFE